MENLLNKIRMLDFSWLYSMYSWGRESLLVNSFYDFFAKYGILIFFFSFIYLIWNKKINALICSFMAMGIAGTADLLIYIFWKRPRPYIAHADIQTVDPKSFTVDIASFPSSHTYIAFAIAVSILLYGHKKLGPFLLLMAVLVALSRIGAGLHYPSDVIAGAMLGTASGILAYVLVNRWEKYWEDPKSHESSRLKEN